jgi:hypothetical protein
VGFGIHRVARSKPGLFRRVPDVQEVADRLGRIARRMEKAAVARTRWKDDRFVVDLELHAHAPRAKLVVEPDSTVRLRAATSAVGPGYHLDVLRRIEHVVAELDYAWTDDDDDSVAEVQRDMCEWFADEVRAGATRIDVKRRFVVEAPVLTMMGPRDAAWREAVLAEPARAADAFAYWQPGAPGHAARARALLAMWHEVPWREPLDDDERALMERVDRDLRAARRADIELAVPWPEWAELHDLLGIDDGYAQESHRRAGDLPPTIGYRRHPLDLELSGGWSLRIGGGFVGRWEEDGARYWATDGTRVIEFTSMTANEELDSDRLLAVAPERHAVVARLVDGDRRGRAEAYDDGDIHVVHGLVANAPHVAILTCKCAATDEPWALTTWRSLKQV